jgi:hypothetical protein
MIASDGGAVPSPGVTTAGSGSHTSVSWGFIFCAYKWFIPIKNATNNINFFISIAFGSKNYNI